ncbi:MAG TPA: sulfotransferase domain-containing protein [Microthrixaceae bacterium]|nr:sulfotransferase domain-containing protein [Microthrixaceae bacterium]
MRSYGSEYDERWRGFEHRAGDIVISTRSKCGTTWMQMICALLVFQTPDLPAPLTEISPWLDWDVEPLDTVTERLAAQLHRRIIKTHTPLDGIPLHSEVTYVVVGRNPLDVAVSLYHHSANLNRARMAELAGKPATEPPTRSMADWLQHWISTDAPPEVELETLRGLVHHIRDASARMGDLDVVLVHYQDLTDDTDREMRSLAARLDIAVDDSAWPELVAAATFDSMKRRARWHAPDQLGVLRDPDAFFRSGGVGEGSSMLTDDELRAYEQRVGELAERDLARWLDRGGEPPG